MYEDKKECLGKITKIQNDCMSKMSLEIMYCLSPMFIFEKKIDKTPKYNKILMFKNIWAVGSRKNKFSAKLDPKHPQIYCNVKRQITKIKLKLHRKTVILFRKTKKNYFFFINGKSLYMLGGDFTARPEDPAIYFNNSF